jgi:hypothetical protein
VREILEFNKEHFMLYKVTDFEQMKYKTKEYPVLDNI